MEVGERGEEKRRKWGANFRDEYTFSFREAIAFFVQGQLG
jgi:hypothetical protein